MLILPVAMASPAFQTLGWPEASSSCHSASLGFTPTDRTITSAGSSFTSPSLVLSIEDIKALPVGELAAKDCALFLWITFPCLCEALEVLTAWGFSYKTVAFVWVKQNRRNDDLFTGMGYWTRANAEICILATKGHPKRVDAGVRQVILSHIEEHSKKPDEARERIVRLMGDLPRVELFARQSPEGWDVWGNEVECTAHLPTEETPCCG